MDIYDTDYYKPGTVRCCCLFWGQKGHHMKIDYLLGSFEYCHSLVRGLKLSVIHNIFIALILFRSS